MARFALALTSAALIAGTASANELLGVAPPAPIDGIHFGGRPPGNADTWVTPFVATSDGRVVGWKAQFYGGALDVCGLPATIQLKILRASSATTLKVVAVGAVHEPKALLRDRFGSPCQQLVDSSPNSVIEFAETGLLIAPGDVVGVTIGADPEAGVYVHPLVSAGTSRLLFREVVVGGTIDLAEAESGEIPGAPALQLELATNDFDGDGVLDSVDACPLSEPRAAVDASGCSLREVCPCAHPSSGPSWKSHGEYMSCFAHAASRFVALALLDDAQRVAEISGAAASACGEAR